jgi:hypothetical protein
MIRLELSQESVHNGDQVTGHASWSSGGGKEPRNVQVICRWRIEGKARRKEQVIDKASAGKEVTFNFKIPRDGPLSYDGKLFRIIWEIVARADIPFARDEEEVKSFLVRPRQWNADEWKEEEEDDDDEEDEEDDATKS